MVTVGTVLQASMRELVNIKGLTEARIEKIKEAARKLDCRGSQFKTGEVVYDGCAVAAALCACIFILAHSLVNK